MPLIPQAPSSYSIEETCQVENLGSLYEALPKPFGVFDPKYKGRFVEVGSFTGPTYSNVWQWVKSGWTGIMIEPMAENLTALRDNLATVPNHNVTVVPMACSDKPGLIPMFFEREGSREAKPGELTHQIQAMRLDDILEWLKFEADFDMLVVDVEAHEQPVLRGFDVAKWKPKVVICEAYGWQRDWIINYFSGYRVYYADGLNVIFVREDWCPA